MKHSNQHVDPQELLNHSDWVTAVARQLIGGTAVAEDVVQDTWLTALQSPPARRGNLRGWLARVMTNRMREVGRREKGLHRREREVARPEALPSVAELSVRAAAQRDVVNHVLALDEPFRSVVLLRFFEDLSPAAIAARLEVPVKTVHSRLHRAFEKLRVKLDRDHGDSKRWGLALAPLLQIPDATPALASGSSAAARGFWGLGAKPIGATLLLLLTGAFWINRSSTKSDGGTLAPVSAAVEPNEVLARVESLDTSARQEAQGESLTASVDPVRGEAISSNAAMQTVRGRVVDMYGAPLVGLAVVFDGTHGEPLATSDEVGRFEAAVGGRGSGPGSPNGPASLRIADRFWMTMRQSQVRGTERDREHIVVAAPVTSIEGRVENRSGAPIPRALVELVSRGDAYFGFPFSLDSTRPVPLETRCAHSGRFVFERFPEAEGLHLRVSADGYQTLRFGLDDAQWPLAIQLAQAVEIAPRVLEGFVVDELGMPVAEAVVQLADDRAKTDSAGRFRIPVGEIAATTILCAGKPGFLTALIEDFGALLDTPDGRPEPVELVLVSGPLGIRGRVIDDSGDPCIGWSVAVVDPTVINPYRMPIQSAEGLARGEEQEAVTDKGGHFALEGLFPRDYTILAFDRSTLRNGEAVIAGGNTNAVISVRGEVQEAVRGVVVDRRGRPVPGVQLSLFLDLVRLPWGANSIAGTAVFSDERGVFQFEGIPSGSVYCSYYGRTILPGKFALPVDAAGQPLEIEVRRRCSFRIEMAQPGMERFVVFEDQDGEPLRVFRFEAGRMTGFESARLHRGASEVLSVSERATAAIVMERGVELSRHEIDLDPDKVNVLRF